MMVKDKKDSRGSGLDKQIRPLKMSSRPGATDLIGQQLRKFYDEVASQPVPNRFLHLLDKLDEAASSKKPK